MEETPSQRKQAAFFIDGLNLYYSVRHHFGKENLWLDIEALCRRICPKGYDLGPIQYCSAPPKGNPDKHIRHSLYMHAIAASGAVTIHSGYHAEKPRTCPSPDCGHEWTDYEEKETDCRLAGLMIVEALVGKSEKLVLITGDTDLVPAIDLIRVHAPDREVVLCLPSKRGNRALNDAVSGRVFHLNRAKVSACQLPTTVQSAKGRLLSKPTAWLSSSTDTLGRD